MDSPCTPFVDTTCSWCFSDTFCCEQTLSEFCDSLLGLQSPSSLREWLEREEEVERELSAFFNNT